MGFPLRVQVRAGTTTGPDFAVSAVLSPTAGHRVG